MALLVDEAIWPWRGRRWAHLVSDSHLDELHHLAHRIGLPYLSFQGDHYDVHEDLRAAAIAEGAVPTNGRDLVRALQSAGLRHRGAIEPWAWLDRRPSVGGRDDVEGVVGRVDPTGGAVERFVADAARLDGVVELGVARRAGEALAVVSTPAAVPVHGGLEVLSATASVHRSSGERGTFVELLVRDR